MALQIRRGTEAERTAGGGVVFAEGELIYVTDTDALYVGDGSTAGGVKLTDNAGATLGTYITADTLNSTIDLQQDLDLNGNDIIGTGNININGTVTATGNINIGDDANTDTVDFTAKITSSLTPNADSTHNIGAMNARWNNGYFTGLTVDGQVDAVAVNADVVADNSTVMVDVSANEFNGNLTGNVTGDTAGTHTGAVIGDVTGNVTGNTTGYHTGDVKGSIFGDDSTPIVDAVSNTLNGILTGNVTGNVTGDIVGNVKGSISNDPIIDSLQGPADAVINAFDITATGTITGDVTGDLNGNVTGDLTGNAAGDHTGTFTGAIAATGTFTGAVTATGTLDGDITGSVFADDSTPLVDAINKTFTGDLTGNVTTSLINSSDSTAIVIESPVTFNTSVTFDQEILFDEDGATSSRLTPRRFENYNTDQDNLGYILTNNIAGSLDDPTDNVNFLSVASFNEQINANKGLVVPYTGNLTVGSAGANGSASILLQNFSGDVNDPVSTDDPLNYTTISTINTSVADFGTPVKFPSFSQAEVDALDNEVGMVVFNTTNAKLEVCTGAGTGGAQTYVALH